MIKSLNLEKFGLGKNTTAVLAGSLIAVVAITSTMIYGSKVYATEDYWDVKVKDKVVATVNSESEAKKVISQVENYYVEKGAKVDKVKLTPTITLTQKHLTEEEAPKTSEVKDVVDKLVTGENAVKTYVVEEGDTEWGIATEHGLTNEELERINSDKDFSLIVPGDEVKVTVSKPYVNVELTQKVVKKEAIEPEIQYEDTDELYEGEEEVKVEGEAGEKEITAKQTTVNGVETSSEVITEKLVKDAKPTVVKRGTKEKPAAASPVASKPSNTSSVSIPTGRGGNAILAAAMAQLGRAQDCTALVSNALAAVGIHFHGWPEQYASVGAYVPGGLAAAQPGDILIYQHTIGANGGYHADHVAIYAGGGTAVHGGYQGTTTVASAYGGSGISVIRPR